MVINLKALIFRGDLYLDGGDFDYSLNIIVTELIVFLMRKKP